MAHDPRNVTLFWLALATGMTLIGFFLARLYSWHLNPTATKAWDGWTDVPLFAGLGLLGFGFIQRNWAKSITMAGWLLFAFYWALVAQDLFVEENGDYVNLFFAIVGTYFFTYLAYHQWLSEMRRVENHTVRFLNISTFVAAGAYFVIDKIEPVRVWLILAVSKHTLWTLNFFGQGAQVGLDYCFGGQTYAADPAVGASPYIVQHCAQTVESTSDLGANLASFGYHSHLGTLPPPPHGAWESITHFDPTGGSTLVIPVSIILACTALQSIMLFVGLFIGTTAPWRKRIAASVIVATVVYVLNLLRNTGIIWFYGQGQASFWVMHDAVGKGGSLVAMVLIAFAAFAWFPEFLKELIGVLDLYHRDGPIERALHIGRRRPT